MLAFKRLASKLYKWLKPMLKMRILLVFDLVFEILTSLELFYHNKIKWGAETIILIFAPCLVKFFITFGKWRKWKICAPIHRNKDYVKNLWVIPSSRYVILLPYST